MKDLLGQQHDDNDLREINKKFVEDMEKIFAQEIEKMKNNRFHRQIFEQHQVIVDEYINFIIKNTLADEPRTEIIERICVNHKLIDELIMVKLKMLEAKKS
jgi:5-methylthioribose kinase